MSRNSDPDLLRHFLREVWNILFLLLKSDTVDTLL